MSHRYLRRIVLSRALVLALAVLVSACARDRKAEVAPAGDEQQPAARGESTSARTNTALSSGQVAALRGALERYEAVRAPLAGDRFEDARAAAPRLGDALRAASSELIATDAALGSAAAQAAGAADSVTGAPDLATARHAFAELSQALIAIAAVDARVAEGLHLFECPMVEKPNRWLQPSRAIDNPYMGTAMATCGVEHELQPPPSVLPDASGGAAANAEEVAYWSCSMHTHVRSDRPGKCPICSMDLVAVTRREVESGEIVVDAARRQTIGVRTGLVERRPLRREVRAVGKVAFDERRLSEVTVKHGGWVERLEVNATGQPVRRGQTLFMLYSPDLYAAQGDYLAALESQRRARETAAPDRADYLVDASRQRLRLWDLRDEDLDRIAASGEAIRSLPVISPASGHVVEKNVVQGAAVEPGQTLYRIASLDRVWVEAEVQESDLALVAVGQHARVTLPNLPGKTLSGKVAFVYPYLDDASRAGRVRIELANPGLELKPAMYADVAFDVDRGEAVMVPESAVLYSGPRRIVFLDLGEGRIKPRPIEVGIESGDWLEVLAGLDEGDAVVTSGTFLVAAESRLKSGTEQWE